MTKQKNVAAQNAETKSKIKDCALEFRDNQSMPRALLDCFEALGIDLRRDVLTWHDRMPVGGPSVAYRGNWLTQKLRFFDYEIYLDAKDEYVTEIDIWEDITEHVEVNERNRGTGKSGAWLSIEVLNELNE